MSFSRAKVAASAVLAGALLTTPAAAQAPAWADLLAAMPESAVSYNGFPLVSYVDLRALERATGAPQPATEGSYRALPEADRARWQRDIIRWLTSMPFGLRDYAARMESVTGTLDHAMGLDFFAIDRVLSFGALPPHEVTVLAGGDDLADPFWMNLALVSRGFAESAEEGATVWSRFGDGNTAIALTDLNAAGDPFDADMNMAARIAVQPGRVTVAHHWTDLRDTLAAGRGAAPTAHAARLLAALFDAAAKVEGGDGVVIQGWAYGLPVVGADNRTLNAVADAVANPQADAAVQRGRLAAAAGQGGPPLPAYPLALFAEVGTADGRQLNVIAIPYPDPATADMAAATVADRLKLWKACPGTDCSPLVSELGGTVTAAIVEDDRVGLSLGPALVAVLGYAPNGDREPADIAAEVAAIPGHEGGAIAVIAVRYPQPAATADARQQVRARLLVALADAIVNGNMTVLNVP